MLRGGSGAQAAPAAGRTGRTWSRSPGSGMR